MRISDWSSDVCSSDLAQRARSRRASRSLRALPSSASAHRKIRYVSVERPCDHGVPDPRGWTSGESRSPRFQAVASTVADYGKEPGKTPSTGAYDHSQEVVSIGHQIFEDRKSHVLTPVTYVQIL